MAHSGTKLGTGASARHSPTSLPGGTDKRNMREGWGAQSHTFLQQSEFLFFLWIPPLFLLIKPGDRNNPIEHQITRRHIKSPKPCLP